jgi:hypothetical protein
LERMPIKESKIGGDIELKQEKKYTKRGLKLK